MCSVDYVVGWWPTALYGHPSPNFLTMGDLQSHSQHQMMSLSNSLWLLKKKSKRLPEPTGGSPEVVHLLKYAFKLFGALMRVLEGVSSKNSFFTLMLSGALRSGLNLKVR